MIQSVFKPSRIKNGKRVRSRIYWGQYRLDPDDPITRLSLRTNDKRVAEKRLSEIVHELELERSGVIAPRSFRSASSQAVSEHLKDFVADLESRGRSADYIRKVRSRVNSLIESCGWERLGDVTADSIISWRSSATLAPRTLNHYLDAAQVLMGWLVSVRRIPMNPLDGVQKVDTRGRATIQRRAFTDSEIGRLLLAAGGRWPIYLIAVQTGLRFNEMRSLRWGDVKLRADGEVSAITLRAMTTKNRRADVIPLTRDAADALRFLSHDVQEPGSAVFSRGMPSHHTVTADLERAGIAKVDELGRRVDFHALRKTFITNLQRAGVKRRVAMALARHSDSRLTDGVYTDTHALPYAEALTQLPRVDLAKLGVGEQADDAQIDAQRLRPHGPTMTPDGTKAAGVNRAQAPEIAEASDEKACHGGTRRDRPEKWSRGESNPRPGVVRRALLRV